MHKKCYIVGAGDNSGTNFSKRKNEYVIAADGGVECLKKLKIIPDLIVGDFDSLGYVPAGDNIIKHAVKKDDTDMMLALREAMERGFEEIEMYGGTGGRIDHTMANFQTMLYASRHGIHIKMIDDKNIYCVISDGSVRVKGNNQGNFSVFAMGGKAVKVNIQGGLYSLENTDLEEDNPTGVSNEFIGNDVMISVEKGSLLIILQRLSDVDVKY